MIYFTMADKPKAARSKERKTYSMFHMGAEKESHYKAGDTGKFLTYGELEAELHEHMLKYGIAADKVDNSNSRKLHIPDLVMRMQQRIDEQAAQIKELAAQIEGPETQLTKPSTPVQSS